MQDTIYLRIDRYKVTGMTKSMPGSVPRGEIVVKVEVNVEAAAFREPALVSKIEVTDWRDGIDLADVEFRQRFITEDEADVIRKQRLAKMADILADHGYTVTDTEAESAPPAGDDDA